MKRTRIGDLQYEAGFPTAETTKKLYDEFDFQRAVLAYEYAELLVAMNEINVGLEQMRGREHAFYVYQHFLDPHGVYLTGNSTTIGIERGKAFELPPAFATEHSKWSSSFPGSGLRY